MGYRILLADDSLTIQKVVELTFSETDFELMAVGSGDRAVEALDSFRAGRRGDAWAERLRRL